MPEAEKKATDLMEEAKAARGKEERHRMEAGEKFDKYLLAGAGGGIYFATILLRYAIQDGPWVKITLITGVFFLLFATAMIFENANLLYDIYSLRRDHLDKFTSPKLPTEKSGMKLPEEEALNKVCKKNRRVQLYNLLSRCFLYFGASSLFASALFIFSLGSQQTGQNKLWPPTSSDHTAYIECVNKITTNGAKAVKPTNSGASNPAGIHNTKSTTPDQRR